VLGIVPITLASVISILTRTLRGASEPPIAITGLELFAEQEGDNPAAHEQQELKGFTRHRYGISGDLG
jgi:hypothetical protein